MYDAEGSLGHSQTAATMNIYAHVVQDTQREAVSHLDRMLKRRLDREWLSSLMSDVDVMRHPRGMHKPPTMIGWGLPAGQPWWARTGSNRRHLLCKSSICNLSMIHSR